jgi:hypothetical protein
MRPKLPLPSPLQIEEHPELAILAAIELCLDLAVGALVALYPELADPERPYWCRNYLDPPAQASSDLAAANSLQDTLTHYHHDHHSRRHPPPDAAVISTTTSRGETKTTHPPTAVRTPSLRLPPPLAPPGTGRMEEPTARSDTGQESAHGTATERARRQRLSPHLLG